MPIHTNELLRTLSHSHKQTDNKQTVQGCVVVAKNPCLHPGDVRVLQAVAVPQLKHLVNVVVFPILGERPHPNELSGSGVSVRSRCFLPPHPRCLRCPHAWVR